MTERKPPDPPAINPRYKGLRLSDAARILTRPKGPWTLGRRWTGFRDGQAQSSGESGVKSGL